jgi:hypothetical protein
MGIEVIKVAKATYIWEFDLTNSQKQPRNGNRLLTSRILPLRTKVAALSFSQRSIVVVFLSSAFRW